MIALFGCFAGLFLFGNRLSYQRIWSYRVHAGVCLVFDLHMGGNLDLGCRKLKGHFEKIAFQLVIWFSFLWAGAQIVYLRIFKQPLLWEGIFRGGQDALTDYWKEALLGILHALPILLLMLAPCVILCILLHRKKWKLPCFGAVQALQATVLICVGIAGEIATMEIGKTIAADYYENYIDFYDPLTVAEDMGFLTMLQRDTQTGIVRG